MILIGFLLSGSLHVLLANPYVDHLKARNEALIEADKNPELKGAEKKSKIDSLMREKVKAAKAKRPRRKKPSMDDIKKQVAEAVRQAAVDSKKTDSKKTDSKTPIPTMTEKKPEKKSGPKNASQGNRIGTTGLIGESGGAESVKFGGSSNASGTVPAKQTPSAPKDDRGGGADEIRFK